MPDMQDFNNLFSGAIYNHIRRAHKFARPLHLSRSAKAGEGRQFFNAVDNRLSEISGSGGIVLQDVLNSGFKLVRCFGCPPNLSHE